MSKVLSEAGRRGPEWYVYITQLLRDYCTSIDNSVHLISQIPGYLEGTSITGLCPPHIEPSQGLRMVCAL